MRATNDEMIQMMAEVKGLRTQQVVHTLERAEVKVKTTPEGVRSEIDALEAENAAVDARRAKVKSVRLEHAALSEEKASGQKLRKQL